MGIFQKLSTLIKSNINDLIAKAENPEKMLNQIILDMRDQLAKAKRDVAGAIADERKLGAQLDAEVKQAQAWQKRAELAVREGRDDLAMQALSRQQEHSQRAQALEQTWRAQKEETEKLKGSLRTLNDKIEEAKRKRNLLIAKQKRAQAQKRIHATMSGLSDQSAFDAFNRMAAKIEEEERRSLAQAEVTEALTGDSLEDEFMRLESGGEGAAMDDRLLALKAKMGLLPGGTPEPPRQLTAGGASAGAASTEDAEADDSNDSDAASSAPAPIQEAQLLEEFERLGRNDGS
ncbi:MAG: PspA/IM30 family protein [Gammaproteobacteria bacterium]|nr:PspA/IM30 family protein [Gammaproteobacteria bacterium]MYC99091.1 PspA/IM30 family protein [Gammaproteobacteria bacterium]MYF61353.1 PspA/IM30 family protein [Gammaproteobacteria bacterium]MYI21278.1 PspA/IM30 family protein [Gammaproteobacteria bacterium]